MADISASDIGPMLSDEERDILRQLRVESNSVIQCYTTFSFQAGTLSAVVLSLIVKFQKDSEIIALAGLMVAFLLHSVVRIGLHKFETANRHAGYELYLYRRTRLADQANRWNRKMRLIGWEESFYVWRIMQPRLYRMIYRKPPNWNILTPTKIRPKVEFYKNRDYKILEWIKSINWKKFFRIIWPFGKTTHDADDKSGQKGEKLSQVDKGKRLAHTALSTSRRQHSFGQDCKFGRISVL